MWWRLGTCVQSCDGHASPRGVGGETQTRLTLHRNVNLPSYLHKALNGQSLKPDNVKAQGGSRFSYKLSQVVLSPGLWLGARTCELVGKK